MNNIQNYRESVKAGIFTENTSGIFPGLVQGNVVILPAKTANDFIEFCQLNPIPCPIIFHSKPGDYLLSTLGKDIDIRNGLPEYHLFSKGNLFKSETNIEKYWQDDFVSIVLGCSFSFEHALTVAGLKVRNVELGLNVSMYDSSITLHPTKHFSGHMVVSMRPFKSHQITQVKEITQHFQHSHGSPIHIGDPMEIGINDINSPDYGDSVPLEDDDVLVFWGCGVTTQRVLRKANLPFLITHAPGKMLVTDYRYSELSPPVKIKSMLNIKSTIEKGYYYGK